MEPHNYRLFGKLLFRQLPYMCMNEEIVETHPSTKVIDYSKLPSLFIHEACQVSILDIYMD